MNKGFTILEAIAAIFVMTVGVLGAYAVVQQIIVYNSISSSRLTAAYLAQEGIEIVRNIRDTNWVEGVASSWYEGLTGCASGYEADYDDTDLSCWSDPGRFLELQAGGFYSYDSGTQPKFKRKITIFDATDLSSPSDGTPDMFKVKVEVLWTEKGKDYTVAVEEHLYNWR